MSGNSLYVLTSQINTSCLAHQAACFDQLYIQSTLTFGLSHYDSLLKSVISLLSHLAGSRLVDHDHQRRAAGFCEALGIRSGWNPAQP